MALEEVQKVLTAEFLKILSFPGFFSEFLPGYRSICSFLYEILLNSFFEFITIVKLSYYKLE